MKVAAEDTIACVARTLGVWQSGRQLTHKSAKEIYAPKYHELK